MDENRDENRDENYDYRKYYSPFDEDDDSIDEVDKIEIGEGVGGGSENSRSKKLNQSGEKTLLLGEFYSGPEWKTPKAHWVISEKGRISDCGLGGPPENFNGLTQNLTDFFIYPAFCDNHLHLIDSVFCRKSLDLSGLLNPSDLFEKLNLSGTPIIGHLLSHWFREDFKSQNQLNELKEPVVLIFQDLHSCFINTAGKKHLFKLNEDGGIWVKRDYYQARPRIQQFFIGEVGGGILEFCQELESKGILFINALDGEPESELQDLVTLKKRFQNNGTSLQILPLFQTFDDSLVSSIGEPRIGGCLLLDGSIGSGTACFSEPFCDGLKGGLYHSNEKLYNFVKSCFERNLQTAFHAIGDQAVDQIVQIYTQFPPSLVQKIRPRIEHAELVSEKNLEEIARMGITLSVQPIFSRTWGGVGGMYEQKLGVQRASHLNRLREFKNRGIPFACGSDSPVTPPDPLKSIHSSLFPPYPHNALDFNSALETHLFTHHFLNHQEKDWGRIEKGFKIGWNLFKKPLLELMKNSDEPDSGLNFAGQVTGDGVRVFGECDVEG